MQKNNINWQPSASISHLKARAELYTKTRAFFAERGVLEVETPLLCKRTVTDPFIESIPALIKKYHSEATYFLQTSPEYAMKRLLAAGSGSIYQLGKAFRQEECGRLHHPEFTMLEWYRVDFNHHQLMDEVDQLLQTLFSTQPATRISYHELFQQELGFNPHTASLGELQNCSASFNLNIAAELHSADDWLNLLMSCIIEPNLGKNQPCIVYDFPVFMSALARIIDSDPPTASRFEVYYNGIELANGFHELNDVSEQRARFEKNNERRIALGLQPVEIDEEFIASLASLPNCAGVALGFDRLVMLALKASNIGEVLSFTL